MIQYREADESDPQLLQTNPDSLYNIQDGGRSNKRSNKTKSTSEERKAKKAVSSEQDITDPKSSSPAD